MSAEPTVGVVIPAFDAERWLAQALDSALAQHHRPVDVLVIDDGSRDATAQVAARHGGPVRVQRQPNAGIGAARNRGVELVQGELVAFLDADDLMTPTSLSARVREFVRRPQLEIAFGHARRFAEIVDGAPAPIGELQSAHVPGMMLVRRSALARVGPFATGVRVTEGLDWLLRAREARLAELTVAEQVQWRRVHDANNSLRHRADIGEFAHALKASLDRRRATGRDAAVADDRELR